MKKDLYWWIVLVLYIFAFIFIVIILINFTSASWILTKQARCNMLNLTTYTDCDMVWCEIVDCPYNAEKQACLCSNSTTGLVNISSINISDYVNISNYYTKSEVNAYVFNEIGKINNSINRTEPLNWSSVIDEKILQLRTDLQGQLYKAGNSLSNTTSSLEDISPIWILIVLVGVGILVMGFTKISKQSPPVERGEAPSVTRKLSSFRELEKDEKIRLLEKDRDELLKKQRDEQIELNRKLEEMREQKEKTRQAEEDYENGVD